MRLLQKSVMINGYTSMVEIHLAAVSNHLGSHTLFLGMMSGHHSLYPLTSLAHAGEAPEATVEVPLVTLDGILGPDVSADLIKIDVEGAELEVIAGAQSLIARNP